MRLALIGLTLAAMVAVVSWSGGSEQTLRAEPPSADTTSSLGNQSGPVVALSHPLENGDLQVVLIDGERRVMSVYHVTAATGAITLKSVRNVQWDLLMEEYNGTKPYPREIRALLQRR